MKAVSFFDYHPGMSTYVLVTLTAEAPTVQWGGSERTDEGWDSWCSEYTLRPHGVRLTSFTDGRDCDGRMSTQSEYYCAFDQLASSDPYAEEGETPAPIKLPTWVQGRSGQRDYSAEAMGY